jgi:RHS repeat-associated protein
VSRPALSQAARALHGLSSSSKASQRAAHSDPAEDWQSNVYDGRGVRVLSSTIVVASSVGLDPPVTRVYFYTPELAMLNIVSPSTGRTADVIWFGSRPVADHGETEVRYTYTDHLGTPILQTTTSGTVAWRAEYEPYGSVYALRSGAAKDDQPLRFPGQQVAYSTGAGEESYNVFRWYRGGWGRYTQADPLMRIGGRRMDAYSYVEGRPITFIDPLGLFGQKQCCAEQELQEIRERIKEILKTLEKAAAGQKIEWTPDPYATTDCYTIKINSFFFGWEGTPFTDYDTKKYNKAGGCVQKCVQAHEKVHQQTCKVGGATAMMKQSHTGAYSTELQCLQNLLPSDFTNAVDYTKAASGQ